MFHSFTISNIPESFTITQDERHENTQLAKIKDSNNWESSLNTHQTASLGAF